MTPQRTSMSGIQDSQRVKFRNNCLYPGWTSHTRSRDLLYIMPPSAHDTAGGSGLTIIWNRNCLDDNGEDEEEYEQSGSLRLVVCWTLTVTLRSFSGQRLVFMA